LPRWDSPSPNLAARHENPDDQKLEPNCGALQALVEFCFKVQQHIPETKPVREHWATITKKRQDFLDLMRKHLALDWGVGARGG
jgi:hypothetical protein